MRAARAAAAILLACAAAAPGRGEAAEERARWGLQLFGGLPLNVATPLRIEQAGEEDLRLRARWRTRPFEGPIYYGVGAHRRKAGAEWYAELVHHKLHLENPPPEVERFSISHGYNLLLVGYGRGRGAEGLWTRVGAGVVIAHPESTVRGRTLREDAGALKLGYYLAGPALSAGIDGRVALGDRLRLVVGGRVTGAYAVVPVAEGRALVPNIAFHATAGLDADVLR